MEERLWMSVIIIALLSCFCGGAYLFSKYVKSTGWTDQTKFMAVPIAITLLSLLFATWLFLQAVFYDFHGQATISGYTLEVLGNDFWSSNYGNDYTIGDDNYKQSFCLPSEQFAMMVITWSCPLFVKPCQAKLVAWDCPYREICPEDCVINGDDAYNNNNNNGQQNYLCDNTDDDYYYNNNNNNGDDDDADDDQDQRERTSEEDLYMCVKDAYPEDTTIGIYGDCKHCTALQDEDYRWATKSQNQNPNLNLTALTVVGILGIAGIVGAIATYFGYDYFVNNTEYDDDDDEEGAISGDDKKTNLMRASYTGDDSVDLDGALTRVQMSNSWLGVTSPIGEVSETSTGGTTTPVTGGPSTPASGGAPDAVAGGADATLAVQSGTMA